MAELLLHCLLTGDRDMLILQKNKFLFKKKISMLQVLFHIYPSAGALYWLVMPVKVILINYLISNSFVRRPGLKVIRYVPGVAIVSLRLYPLVFQI